jgi:hypothetical protein
VLLKNHKDMEVQSVIFYAATSDEDSGFLPPRMVNHAAAM